MSHHNAQLVLESLLFLEQVKNKFENQPEIHTEFMEILKGVISQNHDGEIVAQRVGELFRDHPELIATFNNFLPRSNRIELPPSGQVQGSTPGSNIQGQDPASHPVWYARDSSVFRHSTGRSSEGPSSKDDNPTP